MGNLGGGLQAVRNWDSQQLSHFEKNFYQVPEPPQLPQPSQLPQPDQPHQPYRIPQLLQPLSPVSKQEHPAVSAMTDQDVIAWRANKQITIQGR